jgi:hypothetical protein
MTGCRFRPSKGKCGSVINVLELLTPFVWSNLPGLWKLLSGVCAKLIETDNSL